MHFWINKQSQGGFHSGRHHVPTSLSSGVSRIRQEPKQIVTPVHYIQGVECNAGSACSPRPASHLTQIQQSVDDSSNENSNTTTNNDVSNPSRRDELEVDNNVYLEMPRTENASNADQESTNDSSPPLQLISTHMKCGMWGSLLLASILVTTAKFLFDHKVMCKQGTPIGIVVFCVLLNIFSLSAYTIYLCRARTLPPSPILRAPVEHTAQSQDSNEDLAQDTILSLQVARLIGPPSPEPQLPPYDMAILLPPHNSIDAEAPPPSYEKAIS